MRLGRSATPPSLTPPSFPPTSCRRAGRPRALGKCARVPREGRRAAKGRLGTCAHRGRVELRSSAMLVHSRRSAPGVCGVEGPVDEGRQAPTPTTMRGRVRDRGPWRSTWRRSCGVGGARHWRSTRHIRRDRRETCVKNVLCRQPPTARTPSRRPSRRRSTTTPTRARFTGSPWSTRGHVPAPSGGLPASPPPPPLRWTRRLLGHAPKSGNPPLSVATYRVSRRDEPLPAARAAEGDASQIEDAAGAGAVKEGLPPPPPSASPASPPPPVPLHQYPRRRRRRRRGTATRVF